MQNSTSYLCWPESIALCDVKTIPFVQTALLTLQPNTQVIYTCNWIHIENILYCTANTLKWLQYQKLILPQHLNYLLLMSWQRFNIIPATSYNSKAKPRGVQPMSQPLQYAAQTQIGLVVSPTRSNAKNNTRFIWASQQNFRFRGLEPDMLWP